jgi:protein arginine kinase activator
MLCDVCKKNQAVVHYTEVVNEKVKKLNLCEECAVSKGIGIQPPFSIGELLGGLTPAGLEISSAEKSITCHSCGMSLAEFKETGRMGCHQCYEAFNKTLMPMINNIHKSTKHIGKVPSNAKESMGLIDKIRELEFKLQEAVKKEEFETAAKLRDQIKNMEKKERGKKA